MPSFTILLQRKIDKIVFSALCRIISLIRLIKVKKKLQKENIKKIIVLKIWALGDSVVSLPLFDALRKNFPDAKIDVLAHKRNKIIFEGQKNIDNVVEFGLFNILKLFRKYDLCIDTEPALSVSAVISFFASKYRLGFSHGIRSKLYDEKILFSKKHHMVQNYLDFARKIGIKYNTDKLVPLATSKNDRKAAADYLRKHSIAKNDFVAGISPGVAESVKYRMWPADNFAELADELIKKHKAKIIFIDSKSNLKLIKKIQSMMSERSISAVEEFGSMKDIKKSAELMKSCGIVISNDSGPMHIAAAMGTKTIGLFGPNTPKLWAPYGKNNIALWKPKKGCPFMDNTKPELIPRKLTKEQMTCMDAIKVDDVLNAVERLR